MASDALEDRPSEAEFDDMVARMHATIRRAMRVESVPWWRRVSRLTTVLSALVATGAVAGGAYAATHLFTPPPPPEVLTGSTVIELDAPAPEDKWLNVQMAYTCKPGERFTLQDGERVIFDEDCDAEYYNTDESMSGSPSDVAATADPGAGKGRAQRGIFKSIPVAEVDGAELVLDSTLSREYRLVAVFSPTAAMTPLVLPGRRADGQTDWATPDYTVNQYGLTVGHPRINTPEDQWPDLIPTTFKGREAYLLGDDVMTARAMNPDQAENDTDRLRREGLIDDEGNLYKKVYAADGTTMLGRLLVGSVSER
ncbi:hypothetical protein GL325_01840 [Aeromicrobium sp. 636]|uniref:Uncharacterized protein n=1 Tax=Aeromicrobium senzhongii TaxID=2663859 RepID=A0A8I0ETD7_9ACTN|nr:MULTISPECIES: hypothetical protein [Aeromicrobium]MBC9225056.1 hypothetical protein [Aeromicrobium senzhongii]MCQ3997167.1 hypothetical protein [Aeromicrobium sp. 636]